jgi:multisubunit Na+/H+ antiporter MnhC subunit
MTPILVYTSTGTILFCLGLSGLFVCNHPFRKILAMNFSGSGIFLVLVAFARRQGEVAIDPVPEGAIPFCRLVFPGFLEVKLLLLSCLHFFYSSCF